MLLPVNPMMVVGSLLIAIGRLFGAAGADGGDASPPVAVGRVGAQAMRTRVSAQIAARRPINRGPRTPAQTGYPRRAARGSRAGRDSSQLPLPGPFDSSPT